MKLFEHAPAVAVRDHRAEAASLRGLKRRGKIESPFPGVYSIPGTTDTWQGRLLCAHLWVPEATVVGAAAAKVTWWPDINCDVIELWGPERRSPVPWARVSRAKVPADHVLWLDDMPVADPSLSAVQLAKSLGGNAIDQALRTKATSLERMWAALEAIPNQIGNASVRTLLRRSRREPWSALEREAHKLLDDARIRGWWGNHGLVIRGQLLFIDVCFPGAKLAIELDGFEFHSDRATFHSDRARQNLLVLGGWTVLRYTWDTLPDMVPQVMEFLRAHDLSHA